MTTLKELMVRHLKGTGSMDAFIEGKKGCSYSDTVYAQDDNGCIYFYSRSGNPTYCGFSGGWTPEFGNSTRYVPDAKDDTLNLCIATDQTTYIGCVEELIACVDASLHQGVPLFSTSMVSEATIVSQGISVEPLVRGVESMRDRILEINLLLESLKDERDELVDKITKKGFTVLLELPSEEIKVGTLVELVSVDRSNTAMQIGQRGRVTGMTSDGLDIENKWYVSISDLKFISK